jgi:hypothetical protein
MTAPRPMSAFGRSEAVVCSAVSFSLGAETRRVLLWALGFGRRRKRVWHHAKPTPTSSNESERPHMQGNGMTPMTQ